MKKQIKDRKPFNYRIFDNFYNREIFSKKLFIIPDWIKVCELMLSYNLLASKISEKPNGNIREVISKLQAFSTDFTHDSSGDETNAMKERKYAYALVVCKDYYGITRTNILGKTDKIYEAFTKKRLESHTPAHRIKEIAQFLYP